MASSSQALPEPMNASPHHSKVKVTTTLADPTFVAGTFVSGKLEMECRADKGLGIGIMMVEMFAIQELTSRDHSATNTFIHSRRLFQGPGLPPSNAVQAHPAPGDPPLPQHYYQARRGRSTFLFRIPLPQTSPSSIAFGSGLAKVRYELRASVGVFWKGERRLVLDKTAVDVVEGWPFDDLKVPEGIVVGENGKLWMQGRMTASVVVAGGSACLELQVKNHSSRKNSGLTLTLTRTLYLPSTSNHQPNQPAPIQISDTLTTVPYRGQEYLIPPGAEGVANLVFDVPKHARGVRGGTLDGEEVEEALAGSKEGRGGRNGNGVGRRHSESLFEIRCKVEVKLSMGMGSKDILLEIPIEIVHPRAVPPPNELIPGPYSQPHQPYSAPYPDPNAYYQPHQHPGVSNTPGPGLMHAMPYIDPAHGQVWLPPPQTQSPYPHYIQQPQEPYPLQPPLQPYATGHPMFSPMHTGAGTGMPLHSAPPPSAYTFNAIGNHPMSIQRPSSAGPVPAASQVPGHVPLMMPVAGLPMQVSNLMHQANAHASQQLLVGMQHPVHTGSQQQYQYTGSTPLHQHAVDLQPQQTGAQQQQPLPLSTDAEEGKGERALRVSRHLRMSSRNRSVSPQSHRFPVPGGLPPTVEELPQEILPPAGPLLVPQAPIHGHTTLLSTSPPQPEGTGGVVHSPRPQLTPKHSFSNDPPLGGGDANPQAPPRPRVKSERVEELEKMADVVVRKSRDLSADLPKGILGLFAGEEAKGNGGDKAESNINKTLPGPPVPTGKPTNLLLSPPNASSRARADVYFASNAATPGDSTTDNQQTPPTPTLHAILSSKKSHRDLNSKRSERDLKAESGLDALERRLLAEVGTRKVGILGGGGAKTNGRTNGKGKDVRPDVRSILSPVNDQEDPSQGRGQKLRDPSISPQTQAAQTTIPISIPIKSPEPLNDSAISSLTLAGEGLLGGLGGDDFSDGDGRTHRAGRSKSGSRSGSGSGDEADGSAKGGGGRSRPNGFGSASAGLHMHMRERAEVANGTPKTAEAVEAGKKKEKEKLKEGKPSVRKKDKSAAKGRVAAWLGRIDPDVPPQEQVIPPSPSVVRGPGFGGGMDDELDVDVDGDDEGSPRLPAAGRSDEEKEKVVFSAPPNPRSSGFVPIATLNRSTITVQAPTTARPLMTRDATVVEEARKIQDLWSTSPSTSTQAQPATSGHHGVMQKPASSPRFPLAISSPASPQSIRTDRRVSPPSARPGPASGGAVNGMPLSYSAAARNVWRQADQSAAKVPESSGSANGAKTPVVPNKTPAAGRLPPIFPPPKFSASVDPEVKYDVRSARGGRGGKVASVASLWASGAIVNGSNSQQKDKGKESEGPKRLSVVEEGRSSTTAATQPPPPPKEPVSTKPVRAEKKLFSAAVKTPPKSALRAAHAHAPAAAGQSKPPEAQKRPDSRNLFSATNLGAKKAFSASTTALVNPGPSNIDNSKPSLTSPAASRSTDALVQKRPATSMSTSRPPYSLHGKTTPTNPNLSTPSSGPAPAPVARDHKLHQLAAKGVKPAIIKATSDPAVISSSHAVPHLSSTASLARPHGHLSTSAAAAASSSSSPMKNLKATSPASSRPAVVKLPTILSAPTAPKVVSSLPVETPRPVSPSKPVDLAFGQARLRDLIKKYQGQGQKS